MAWDGVIGHVVTGRIDVNGLYAHSNFETMQPFYHGKTLCLASGSLFFRLDCGSFLLFPKFSNRETDG